MELKGPDERRPRIVTLNVIKWNMLRLIGARVEDVATLIDILSPRSSFTRSDSKSPGERLPALVGGRFFANRWTGAFTALVRGALTYLAQRPRATSARPTGAGSDAASRRANSAVGRTSRTCIFRTDSFVLHAVAPRRKRPRRTGGCSATIMRSGRLALPASRILVRGKPPIVATTLLHSVSIAAWRGACAARTLSLKERGPSHHHRIRLDLQVLPRVRGSDGSTHHGLGISGYAPAAKMGPKRCRTGRTALAVDTRSSRSSM